MLNSLPNGTANSPKLRWCMRELHGPREDNILLYINAQYVICNFYLFIFFKDIQNTKDLS